MKPIDIFYENVYVLGTLCSLGLSSFEALDYVKQTGETLLDQIYVDCKGAFEQKMTFDDILVKQEENQTTHPELVIFYTYLKTSLQFFTGSFMEFKKPALLYAIATKGDVSNNEFQKTYVKGELEIFQAEHPMKMYFLALEPLLATDSVATQEGPVTNDQLFSTVEIKTETVDTNVVEKITKLCEMMGMDTSQYVSELSWFREVLAG